MSDLYKKFSRQYNLVLDTSVSLSNDVSRGCPIDSEVSFDFMNKKIRWINHTDEYYAILIIYHGKKDILKCKQVARRLISLLIKEYGHPINELFDVDAPSAPDPCALQPLNSGSFVAETPDSIGSCENISDLEWIALALFKEGINSRSVYYKFLSHYKILELIFPVERDRKKWINGVVLNNPKFEEWKNRLNSNEMPYKRLYGLSRTAIAHAYYGKKNKEILNPDDLNDYQRIFNEGKIIRQLASLAINTI